MLQHRKNAQLVVSLLAYILKDSDPTGLDICFTQSTKMVNSKKSKDIATAIIQEPFQGISDMRTRLSQILQEHISKFGTTTTPTKSLFNWRTRHPEPQKALSFYIITDGIWQPKCEVEPVITFLVESMKKHRLPKEHVGIQFIRFGDDLQAIARLKHLDQGLGLKDIGMYVAYNACSFLGPHSD